MNNTLLKFKTKLLRLFIFLYFSLSILAIPPSSLFASVPEANQLVSISEKLSGNTIEIIISGKSSLISTVYSLPNPDRIIVDLADSIITPDFQQQYLKLETVSVNVEEIKEAKPSITRLVVKPTSAFKFTHINNGNNLNINITKEISKAEEADISPKQLDKKTHVKENFDNATSSASTVDSVGNLINKTKEIQNQLPVVNPLNESLSKQASVQQMHDAFNFSGYNKERITVEFQKMDLHNVFNFLRQVSGVNIVVDESVQGSLTLVLDDVPWDFALDIILNLKNLEKEDRFNTLVIYPKGKGFIWPKQAENNLSFEADTKVVEQEALSIKQYEIQSLEIIEAKQHMSLAREAEKREDFETAIRLYEQAFEKWPTNSRLANQISSIYLIHLRQNAKALYFADQSIRLDPENRYSYLNAGIASSNMQEFVKAKNYFEKSIDSKKPSKEALLSYAAFCENRGEFTPALSLLEKHDNLFGVDLNSMVSSARIHDKMGKPTLATDKYRAILHAGFQIPSDLDTYIKQRTASNN